MKNTGMKTSDMKTSHKIPKMIHIFPRIILIFLIFTFISSCSNKPGKVHETDGQIIIEIHSYRLVVDKEGFRFGFQDRNGNVIIPAHNESGFQIGTAPDRMLDPAFTNYEEYDGKSYIFSIELTDNSKCRIEINLAENTAHFAAIPEKGGNYTILFRAGGVSPGYGLGDGLIQSICPGWRTPVIEGKGTEITGFTDDDYRSNGSRERCMSNFAIYPVNKFAWVNVYPLSKIIRSTTAEIVQGSNAVSTLDQLYIFFGDPKQIYLS